MIMSRIMEILWHAACRASQHSRSMSGFSKVAFVASAASLRLRGGCAHNQDGVEGEEPMRKIFVAGLAFAGFLVAGEAEAQKKTLVIGMGSADAGKLDPHIASTTPDKGLLQYIFNGLVRMKPGQISPDTIEPDLAESWTANPAGTEWTFHIRHGVQCHWGLRRVHRGRRGLFDQARREQGDVVLFERFLQRRQRRRRSTIYAEDHPEESGRRLSRLRRQHQRRQHGLQESRGGDGRRLLQEADRHRPVHVRRISAAAIRAPRRQQTVFPRRADARRDHVPLHPFRFEPRSRLPVGRARHDLRQAGSVLG